MIDVLRIAHLRNAPQEGNLEVGNCEGNRVNKALQCGAKQWRRWRKVCGGNSSPQPAHCRIISRDPFFFVFSLSLFVFSFPLFVCFRFFFVCLYSVFASLFLPVATSVLTSTFDISPRSIKVVKYCCKMVRALRLI